MGDRVSADLPPHDADAEQAVIGAVLFGGRPVLDRLTDAGLRAEHFYAPRHEEIYAATVALDQSGSPLEPVSVASALTEAGSLKRIGGAAYLTELLEACVTPVSAPHHAKTIINHAYRRAIGQAGTRVQALADPTAGSDIAELIDAAQGEVQAVADRFHGRASTGGMSDAIEDLLKTIETGDIPATPTGISDLDDALAGGLRPGTFTTIAARPGVGKTVVGVDIALRVAARGGKVGYSSLEMTRADLLRRAGSAMSGVDYRRILLSPNPQLSREEFAAVQRAFERIRDSGLEISDQTTAGVAKIRADIRRMIRAKGSCALWVVDYLQLITPADRRVPREQQVATITRSLKQLALETGVPIVILAQLNREGEKVGRPPIITDIRESGAIEQDSDAVLLLHRDVENAPDQLRIRVAKNRRGSQESVTVTFDGSRQRILTPGDQRTRQDRALYGRQAHQLTIGTGAA